MGPNIEAGIRILQEPDVRRLTGVSRGTRWRWEKDGEFPQRVRLGKNIIGWREHEILQWIQSMPRV
jgi:prophage regulatory protein